MMISHITSPIWGCNAIKQICKSLINGKLAASATVEKHKKSNFEFVLDSIETHFSCNTFHCIFNGSSQAFMSIIITYNIETSIFEKQLFVLLVD